MNGNIQQQQNAPQQIAGVIRNFRKVSTRTGKPLAVFTLGTLPAKCFDVNVDTAEQLAVTGEKVLITGHFSYRQGQIELVAEGIGLAAPGQTNAQSYPEIAGVVNQAPIRETSTITENLSGYVTSTRAMKTHSGRPMITFRIGNSSCKAFGDLASAIHKAEGKQIEVSARKGRFQGVTEYAIETVKTINGTTVDLRDSRTISPEEHVSKTSHASEAINLPEKTESDPFEVFCRCIPGSGSPSSAGMGTVPDQQPLANPGQDSPREEQTEVLASIEKDPSEPEPIKKHTSALSASAEEALILQDVLLYRKAEFFPDKFLEKRLNSGSRFASEAARRVLEERARQKAEDNRRSEDFVVVEAA